MTTLNVTCPVCGRAYPITPTQVGQRVQCRACSNVFVAAPMGEITPQMPMATAAFAAQSPKQANGLAIASFICSLLLCIPLSSVLAVVLGFIGLKETRRPNVGGRGFSIAGITLGVLGIVGWATAAVLMFGSIAFPAFGAARETANRAKCAANLRQIGVAINQYAATHNGELPDKLATLGTMQAFTVALTCPDDQAGSVSYQYFGTGQRFGIQQQNFPIVIEPLSLHKVGINALFPDGHVEWLDQPRARSVAAMLPALNRMPPGMPMPGMPRGPSRAMPPTFTTKPALPQAIPTNVLIGTWTTPAAEIDRGHPAAATVTFDPDGTYVYRTDGAKGPIEFSGKWNVTRTSVRMTCVKVTDVTLPFFYWRNVKPNGATMNVHGRYVDETWTKS